MAKEFSYLSEFNLTEVVILDCLSDSELQTARLIYDFLLDVKNSCHDKSLNNFIVRYVKIKNRNEFLEEFGKISGKVDECWNGVIHIECHGGSGFIHIGRGGECVSYVELIDIFRPINEISRCGLGVVLACCNVGDKYIIKDYKVSAPFYFCLSYVNNVSAGDMVHDVKSFYQNILCEKLIIPVLNAPCLKLELIEEIFLKSLQLVLSVIAKKEELDNLREGMITTVSEIYDGFDSLDKEYKRLYRKLTKDVASKDYQIDWLIGDSVAFLCGKKLNFSIDDLKLWLKNSLS